MRDSTYQQKIPFPYSFSVSVSDQSCFCLHRISLLGLTASLPHLHGDKYSYPNSSPIIILIYTWYTYHYIFIYAQYAYYHIHTHILLTSLYIYTHEHTCMYKCIFNFIKNFQIVQNGCMTLHSHSNV